LAGEYFGRVGTAKKLVEKTNNFLLMRVLVVSVLELWFYRYPYSHLRSTLLYVHGYHRYRTVWESPAYGEVLRCEREVGNSHDTYTGAINR